MEQPHSKSTEEVLAYFNVSEEAGLSEQQVTENVKKYGHNGRI